MRPLDDSSFSFVVKIWKEPGDPGTAPPDLRGSVENVVTGRRVYFLSLDELCQHLGRASGMRISDRSSASHHPCQARRNHGRCDWD
jgi:hypothetical protein